MVMRDASTVSLISSTVARRALRSSRSATAISASFTRPRAPMASSSNRVTARRALSNFPAAMLRSASTRLSARLVSDTPRSASRRASRASRSALVSWSNRCFNISWAFSAPSAREVTRAMSCFSPSRRFICCNRNAAADGASSAPARNPSQRHKSPSTLTKR